MQPRAAPEARQATASGAPENGPGAVHKTTKIARHTSCDYVTPKSQGRQQAPNEHRNSSLNANQQQQRRQGESARQMIDFKRLHAMEMASRKPQEPFKFAGYLGTLVASLFASLGVLCIKLLPVTDSIQEMSKASMIRGLFMVLFCGASILIKRESFLGPADERWINFVRAMLGALVTLLSYVALEFITMGECSALIFSSPVWTCILGFIVLKEPLPISLFLAVPMCVLGIILLADPDLLVFIRNELTIGFELQPEQEQHLAAAATENQTLFRGPSLRGAVEGGPVEFDQRLIGIAIALLASFFMSGVIVSFRYRNTTSIPTCSIQFGVALAAVAAIAQVFVGFGAWPVSWLEWTLHLSIAVFSYGCQVLFQWSLQFVPAGIFSVMRSLDIVLGFVLGAAFLRDVVLWTSVAGSILIAIVVVMLLFNDYLKEVVKSLCCSRR